MVTTVPSHPAMALTFPPPMCEHRIQAPSMPSVLKIDLRRRLVYSSFYGKVTGDELASHSHRILADPYFSADFDEIVDFTDVRQTLVNEATLAAMAGARSIYGPSSLHIVIAPSDLPFDLAVRYQKLAQQTRPNLFVVRTTEEAYRLLDQRHPSR